METRKISLPYYNQAKALRTSKRQSQSPIEGFVQFPSTFYTPDALGYMSHSLNRSHIRLAYFQPMASCLADGFFPSRLICKIKNFFDVSFHIFFIFFVGVGWTENTQENTNACGHYGNASAGIEIGFYRFVLRARSRVLKVVTCFQTGKFLPRFFGVVELQEK